MSDDNHIYVEIFNNEKTMRKQRAKTIEIIIVLAILLLVALVFSQFCGCKKRPVSEIRPSYNDGFKEGLEVAKYPKYIYPDVEEMVYSLCEEKGIDSNQAFLVCCPRCYFATCLRERDDTGVAIFGFLAAPENSSLVTLDQCGERVIETRSHCGGCKHIFGSDWLVVGCKKQLCKHENIVLKADPVVLERKVGAIAVVNYRPFCAQCGVELELESEQNKSFFDTNRVSESVRVEWSDNIEFSTSGSWWGWGQLEYSEDGKNNWTQFELPSIKVGKKEIGRYITSRHNGNIQFTDSCIDNDLPGLITGYYRINMEFLWEGRCDYYWGKRARAEEVIKPNKVSDLTSLGIATTEALERGRKKRV